MLYINKLLKNLYYKCKGGNYNDSTIKKRILYPERNVYGDGRIVAMGYIREESPYSFYDVRSYSKKYYVSVYSRGTMCIEYNDARLRRVKKRIYKKMRQGYLTHEQVQKIILTIVCNIVEEQL